MIFDWVSLQIENRKSLGSASVMVAPRSSKPRDKVRLLGGALTTNADVADQKALVS